MHRSPIKHCRNCGTSVVYRLPDDGDTKERAICTACQTVHYENPLNVVGTVRHLDARIATPVIAGVNSFSAACADVGVPLSEQDDTIAIVPAAYGVHALERLLPDFDTLVLMKIKPILDDLLDWLQQRDLLSDSHFIERSGAVDERTLSGSALLQLRGSTVSYLSLLLVKNPLRIRGERIRGCLKKSPQVTEAHHV